MGTNTIDYIRAKGWAFKTQGNESVIQICPYCQDQKYHFYVNQEGLYFCHKCQAKGNLYKLKQHMGDIRPNMRQKRDRTQIKQAFEPKAYKLPDQTLAVKYHEALFKHPEAMDYLSSRGITRESIDKFKLGYMHDKQGTWISIPHFQKGKLINIKFRHVEPRPKGVERLKRIKGCQSILFNIDSIKSLKEQGIKEIIITEGELDGITFYKPDLKMLSL